MNIFLALVLFSLSLPAAMVDSLKVVKLVPDDEGTKVIAQSSSQKTTVLYLSQTNEDYENIQRTLVQAELNQSLLQIESARKKDDLNLIIKAELKK